MAAIVDFDMLFEPALKGRLEDQSNAQEIFWNTAIEMHSETVGI